MAVLNSEISSQVEGHCRHWVIWLVCGEPLNQDQFHYAIEIARANTVVQVTPPGGAPRCLYYKTGMFNSAIFPPLLAYNG